MSHILKGRGVFPVLARYENRPTAVMIAKFAHTLKLFMGIARSMFSRRVRSGRSVMLNTKLKVILSIASNSLFFGKNASVMKYPGMNNVTTSVANPKTCSSMV